MAVIRNEDLETMEKVSKILYNTICSQNVGNNEYYNIMLTFQDMVKRFVADKNNAKGNSSSFNKKNPEYHKIMNNISSNKKNNNLEKVEYWKNKLKELKESGIC